MFTVKIVDLSETCIFYDKPCLRKLMKFDKATYKVSVWAMLNRYGPKFV
jgi:hypothetical protein